MNAEFAYRSKRPLHSTGSSFTPRSTRGIEGPEGPISGSVSRHQGELSVMERALRDWRSGFPASDASAEVPATTPSRRAMLIERLRQASDFNPQPGQRVRQLEDHPGDLS